MKLDPLFVPRYNYYNVTPAVLNRDAVIQLQEYLKKLPSYEVISKLKLTSPKRSNFLLLVCWLLYRLLPKNSILRNQLIDYRAYLIRNIPWTEYTLYYNFCEAQNLLDKHHIQTPYCIYAGKESVWQEKQYTNWQPEVCFEGERNFFFCVFQSNTQIPAKIVWQKVERFLQ